MQGRNALSGRFLSKKNKSSSRKSGSLEGIGWTRDQLAVKKRLKVLESFRGYFALTLDEEWLKSNPHVPALTKLLGMSPAQLKEIVDSRPGQLWVTEPGHCWNSVFITHCGISQYDLVYHNDDVPWVTFYPDASEVHRPADFLRSPPPLVRCAHWSRLCLKTELEADSEAESNETRSRMTDGKGAEEMEIDDKSGVGELLRTLKDAVATLEKAMQGRAAEKDYICAGNFQAALESTQLLETYVTALSKSLDAGEEVLRSLSDEESRGSAAEKSMVRPSGNNCTRQSLIRTHLYTIVYVTT